MANILAMGGAHSNSMYVAAADRVGVERDQPFLGCSLIVSHTGFPLAGPASKSEEEIIYAELNLSDARRKRVLNNFNQPLRDRRIDLYDEMLGASIKRGWYWLVSRASLASATKPGDADLGQIFNARLCGSRVLRCALRSQ